MQVWEYFSDQQRCVDYLIKVRWKDGITCAFCKHDKVYTLTRKNKRYKCSKCLKQFSAIKGTIFENSSLPLQKWFIAIYLVVSNKKGISSVQLAKHIGVTQKTAWFMLHRIRYMFRVAPNTLKVVGPAQMDETFVGGKNKNRRWDKKVKNSQGRSFKDKTPVFGIIDGNMKLFTKVIPDTTSKTIKPIIYKIVEPGSIVVTDEWKAYVGLNGKYEHYIVDHLRKEYVNDQGFTTNAVEGAWSHLKRMIIGVYHQVRPQYLQRYCDEFTFRFNTRDLTDIDRFADAFKRICTRLTGANLTKISEATLVYLRKAAS